MSCLPEAACAYGSLYSAFQISVEWSSFLACLPLCKYPMFSVGHLVKLGRSPHHNNPLITPSELSNLYRDVFTDSGHCINEEMKGLI